MDMIAKIDINYNLMKKPKTILGKIKLARKLIQYLLVENVIDFNVYPGKLLDYYTIAYYFGLILKPNKNSKNFKIFSNKKTRDLILKKASKNINNFILNNFNINTDFEAVEHRLQDIKQRKGWL